MVDATICINVKIYYFKISYIYSTSFKLQVYLFSFIFPVLLIKQIRTYSPDMNFMQNFVTFCKLLFENYNYDARK